MTLLYQPKPLIQTLSYLPRLLMQWALLFTAALLVLPVHSADHIEQQKSITRINSDSTILTYFLENEPVYTSSNTHKPGLLLELVYLIQQQLHISPAIHFVDWLDAQKMTQERENSLIFPLTRTPDRQPHYLWVAKIFDVPVMFITLEGSSILNHFDEIETSITVGVIKGTPQEQQLKDEGIHHYIAVSVRELYEGLAGGQFQYIYGAKPEALYGWRVYGNELTLRFGETLQILPLWIAANPNSNQINPDDWRLAIQRIRESGQFGHIARKYFGLY